MILYLVSLDGRRPLSKSIKKKPWADQDLVTVHECQVCLEHHGVRFRWNGENLEWVKAIPLIQPPRPLSYDEEKPVESQVGADARLRQYLKKVYVNHIAFHETMPDEFADIVKDKCGVNLDVGELKDGSKYKVTIELDNVPPSEVIRYFCKAAGLHHHVKSNRVVIHTD